MSEFEDNVVDSLINGRMKMKKIRNSNRGLRCCGFEYQCFTGDRVGKLLCGIMIILAIVALLILGFAIAMLASLPSLHASASAPVEMNERMKLVEVEAKGYLARLIPKFPSNQIEVTLTQTLDTIDNAHSVISKFNGAISDIDSKVISKGIESTFSLFDKANRAIGTEKNVNVAQIGSNLEKITSRVAEYLDNISTERVDKLINGTGNVAEEANRLMKGITSDHWTDVVVKVHSIISQIEADEIFDNLSRFMGVVSKIASKMDSENGLVIKL